MELKELIERVKAATGPGRGLDGDIAEALGQVPAWCTKRSFRQPELWSDNGPGLHAKTWLAEKYTGSIDAALALVDRRLPGWKWNIGHDANDELHATVWHGVREFDEYGLTPPLAIILALLTALDQKEENK